MLNIDYALLYQQRQELIEVQFGTRDKSEITDSTIEGLTNLCDGLLDEAEENGEFTFPEIKEEI